MSGALSLRAKCSTPSSRLCRPIALFSLRPWQTAVTPETIAVHVVQLPRAEGLLLPEYQSEQAAGLDLTAAVDESAPLILTSGGRPPAVVPHRCGDDEAVLLGLVREPARADELVRV